MISRGFALFIECQTKVFFRRNPGQGVFLGDQVSQCMVTVQVGQNQIGTDSYGFNSRGNTCAQYSRTEFSKGSGIHRRRSRPAVAGRPGIGCAGGVELFQCRLLVQLGRWGVEQEFTKDTFNWYDVENRFPVVEQPT